MLVATLAEELGLHLEAKLARLLGRVLGQVLEERMGWVSVERMAATTVMLLVRMRETTLVLLMGSKMEQRSALAKEPRSVCSLEPGLVQGSAITLVQV